MSDVKFDRLIRGVADSPALIAYLEANFADAHLRDFLLSEAEESLYPLRQWLEALHLFDQWLDTRGFADKCVCRGGLPGLGNLGRRWIDGRSYVRRGFAPNNNCSIMVMMVARERCQALCP